MLLMLCLLSSASCRPTSALKSIEVPASVNCHGSACIAVTRAFVDEHAAILVENIRLKAALKACQEH